MKQLKYSAAQCCTDDADQKVHPATQTFLFQSHQAARQGTGKAAHNFFPRGDGRHWFLSNRVEGTVSLVDVQEMKVVGSVKVPGGPDCMDITPDGKELWVTQRFLRRVAVVDLEQMKMVASIPVGKSPHGVMMLKGAGPAGVVRAASTASDPK